MSQREKLRQKSNDSLPHRFACFFQNCVRLFPLGFVYRDFPFRNVEHDWSTKQLHLLRTRGNPVAKDLKTPAFSDIQIYHLRESYFEPPSAS